MRQYEFAIEVNGQTRQFEAKTLPLVKATMLLQAFARIAMPILPLLIKEEKGEQWDEKLMAGVSSSGFSEKEIENIYRLLFCSMRVLTPSPRELIQDNSNMFVVDELFSGDLGAIIEVGKVVIKENFGSLGKFLTQTAGLGKSIIATSS